MMKKFVKKSNKKEIVFAEQIENNKKVLLKEFSEYREIEATEGDWIVTESDGNQCIYGDKSFNLYFEPYKDLLLD